MNALCLLSDGQLASSSDDGAIRLWDVVSGLANESRWGHHGKVSSLCRLTDGRLAFGPEARQHDLPVGCGDRRSNGAPSKMDTPVVLTLFAFFMTVVLLLDLDDETIRLWDVATLQETARLDGHTRRVSALCLLADGGLASGSG